MDDMDIRWTHLNNVLMEFADRFIELARNDLETNGTNASWNLFNSMTPIVDIEDNHYSVKIELADYWKYVENGRLPGKFPPLNRIKEWIEIKPVIPYMDKNGRLPTTDQLAFLIGRKIAEEGTEPQKFFEKNKRVAVSEFKDSINEAIDADVRDYIEQLVIGRMYRNLMRCL